MSGEINPTLDGSQALAALRRFVRPRSRAEKCELCNAELQSVHEHLLELARRKILCSCQACALLFGNEAAARYRRVPRDVRILEDFRMTDAQWDGLMIPINLAFFFRSTPESKVLALYPSPAGAVESLLDLSCWEELVEQNPRLKNLQADVDALLVNRVTVPHQYFVAPIDECYRLVGLIRTHWQGLSGGSEVWKQIGQYFLDLQQRSSSARGTRA
ncbi:MAG: hypothetical protein JWO20_2029 [Candidatus Angelobacter sp.]|jgi:hypothetical protein|nr:hypothetical protein [Candidatus Angelobacter sp.]